MRMKTICSVAVMAAFLASCVMPALGAVEQPGAAQRTGLQGSPPGPPPGPQMGQQGPMPGDISFEDKAKELGIDITGLSEEEAKARVETAEMERLKADAGKLGIDISGLSLEEAKEKLADAIQAQNPKDMNPQDGGRLMPPGTGSGGYAKAPIKPGDKFKPPKPPKQQPVAAEKKPVKKGKAEKPKKKSRKK